MTKKLFRCSTCGEEKPRSEFYNNAAHKSGVDSQCKECRKDLNHYQKDYLKNRNQARMAELANEADRKGCTVCGKPFNGKRVSWHHRWPWLKNSNLSGMKNASDETFQNEKAMCDPVCSSCHAKIHFVLRGYKNIKGEKVHDYIDKWLRRGGK